MEAQSQGLACISTNVSAIPELIIDGETGVLVPPEDPDSMAAAIADLAVNVERRLSLGKRGDARVRVDFSFDAGVDRIAEKLGAASTVSERNAA